MSAQKDVKCLNYDTCFLKDADDSILPVWNAAAARYFSEQKMNNGFETTLGTCTKSGVGSQAVTTFTEAEKTEFDWRRMTWYPG
jgi:hypothetical protein